MIDPTRRTLMLAGLAAPLLLLPACATTGLGGMGGGMPEALRRLLAISSERALSRLVSADGFLNDPDARISVPGLSNDRASAVLGALLRSRPVQDRLALIVNRAAGEAAERAAPLVYDSIRSLTFTDAIGIAQGGPTAATAYLERSIGSRIIDAMFPEIGGALRQFDGDSVLGPVLGAATGIDVSAMQRSVTEQAARGLWRAIGREEAAIRAAPSSAGDPLVTALLTGSRLLN